MQKNYLFIPPQERTKGNVNVLDVSGDTIKTQERQHRTEEQLQKIFEENQRNEKKSLITLGKKGDTFVLGQEKYLILERTDQYMFLEITELLPNPDGSVPNLPLSKRATGKTYYDVRRVFVAREPETDGFDRPTGILSGPKESIRPGINLEFFKEGRNGMPTDEPGFNSSRGEVFGRYVAVIKEFETTEKNRIQSERELKEAKEDTSARLQKIDGAKKLRLQSLTELKVVLKDLSVEKAMKSKRVEELTATINKLDTIIVALIRR
jgi:hypothetical protein